MDLRLPIGDVRVLPVDPLHTRLVLPDGREYLLPLSFKRETDSIVLLAVILSGLYDVKATSFTGHERRLLRILRELSPERTSDNPFDSARFMVVLQALSDLDSTFELGPATDETVQEMLEYVEKYCEENLAECLEDPSGTALKLFMDRALRIFKEKLAEHYDGSVVEELVKINGPYVGDDTAFNRKERVLRVLESPELLARELDRLLGRPGCSFRVRSVSFEKDSVVLDAVLIIEDGSVFRTGHYTLTFRRDRIARHLYRMFPSNPSDEENYRFDMRMTIRRMLLENGFMVETDGVLDMLVFGSKIAVCKPMLGPDTCHVFNSYDELRKYLYLGVTDPVIPTREFLERAGDFIPGDEKRRLLETGCFNCEEPERYGRILVSENNNAFVISVPRRDGTRNYIRAVGERELAHYLSKLLLLEEKKTGREPA